jgi:hypothetical protein
LYFRYKNKKSAQKIQTLFTKSSIKTLNVQHVRQYVTVLMNNLKGTNVHYSLTQIDIVMFVKVISNFVFQFSFITGKYTKLSENNC